MSTFFILKNLFYLNKMPIQLNYAFINETHTRKIFLCLISNSPLLTKHTKCLFLMRFVIKSCGLGISLLYNRRAGCSMADTEGIFKGIKHGLLPLKSSLHLAPWTQMVHERCFVSLAHLKLSVLFFSTPTPLGGPF